MPDNRDEDFDGGASSSIAREFPPPLQRLGILVVDHGSRLTESNQLLEVLVERFGARFADQQRIIEPAHMELAEPSIATAYSRCVARGAWRIAVLPFFLGPGKHWTQDIPRLTAAAQALHPETSFKIAAPLGIDDLLLDLLEKRLSDCLGGKLPTRSENC